jgi:hypothetical protein
MLIKQANCEMYLIDSAGDKTRHIRLIQGNWERARKCRASLGGGERTFTNIIRGPEAKNSFRLVVGNELLDLQNGWV